MNTRRILVERPPFFQVGGVWFADLLWNFGHWLTVDVDQLARYLAIARPPTFVVGRRLDDRQRRVLDEYQGDFEDQAYASIFPRDSERWR